VSNREYSKEKIDLLRERVKYEDGVLNNRTSLILTFNALMAIAASISTLSHAAQVGLAAILLIVDILWLTCSLEAWLAIREWTKPIRESSHKPIDEEIRFHLFNRFPKIWHRPLRIGPSFLFGLLLPLLLIVFWIIVLVFV